jgi:y4mF family transcriptional regulator
MLLRRPHDLADLFRDARARLGWSQSELAARVGVSRQWISLVETGKTSVEFDLVVGALQALGYRLYVESSEPATRNEAPRAEFLEIPAHIPSPQTPLTRGGDPLGRQRTRRRTKGSGKSEDVRG